MSSWAGRPYLAILGGKEEDRFTNYLAELLKDPDMLAAFTGTFLKDHCGLLINSEPGMTAQTQVTVAGGRPDLAIRAKSTYLLFEAKVSSWLHEDQLKPYAEELEKWKKDNPKGAARLFVLVPESQVNTSLVVARQQLSEPPLNNCIPIAISWEQVANFFATRASGVDDRNLCVHLNDFKELVNYRFGTMGRPFTSEEVKTLQDSLVANALERVLALVDKVVASLGERGVNCSVSRGTDYIGYNLRYGERGWWYGLWITPWARLGASPAFLQLLGLANRPAPSIPDRLPGPFSFEVNSSKQYVVPLVHREGVGIDIMAEEHSNLIWRYLKEVPNSGG
jgi:hypothetical protein